MRSKKKKKRDKRLYIAFEGIDGCGKGAQINLLKKYLEKQGKNVAILKLGNKANIAGRLAKKVYKQSKIRVHPFFSSLLDSWSVRFDMLFNLGRKENIVLLDRTKLSNLVYGKGLHNYAPKRLINLNWLGTKKPNILFFLDVKPQTAFSRIKKERGNRLQYHENIKKLEDVRKIYFDEIKKQKEINFIKIQTENKTLEEVNAEIIKKLKKHLSNNSF